MENERPEHSHPLSLSLRWPQNQLVKMVDMLPALVGYIDSRQRYLFANKCHEKWFNIPVGEIENKHISEIIGLSEYEHALSHIEDALSGKATTFEMQMHHKGSGNIVARVSFIPDQKTDEETGETEISGFSLLVEDVSKLKLEAEKAIYAKNAFLATMSHEIRTPLNGILGMTELLLNTELNEKQLKYANTVSKSGESLLEIINDILDFCKIEAGEMEIESTFVNLQDIAQGVINSLSHQAAEKGNTLTLHYISGTPSNAVGDPIRVKQMLTNLVSNAIKFTANGTVDLIVKNRGRNEKGVKFLFEIKDTGIGICPDKINYIFDRFSQFDAANIHRFGGTGLGLAISHKITGLMGGAIGVESKEGEGSTFWFTLCLPAEEGGLSSLETDDGIISVQSQHIEQEKQAWAEFKAVHILLAEDDAINQQMTTAMLEAMNCRVSLAATGRDVIRLMNLKETFDLILMDCNMPELDGYQTSQIIKQSSNIPIIALTASAMSGDKDRCFDAGMDDYMSKPIKHASLEKILLKWIAKEKLAQVG